MSWTMTTIDDFDPEGLLSGYAWRGGSGDAGKFMVYGNDPLVSGGAWLVFPGAPEYPLYTSPVVSGALGTATEATGYSWHRHNGHRFWEVDDGWLWHDGDEWFISETVGGCMRESWSGWSGSGWISGGYVGDSWYGPRDTLEGVYVARGELRGRASGAVAFAWFSGEHRFVSIGMSGWRGESGSFAGRHSGWRRWSEIDADGSGAVYSGAWLDMGTVLVGTELSGSGDEGEWHSGFDAGDADTDILVAEAGLWF
jgi:hypothetical protein